MTATTQLAQDEPFIPVIERTARTRRGLRVTILAVLDKPDTNGESIVGIVHGRDGDEIVTWKADGSFHRGECHHDLVEMPR